MKKLFGRVLIVVPAIALQAAWFYFFLVNINGVMDEHIVNAIHLIFTVLAVMFVTNLIAKRDESSYRLLWVLVITALPIFGALLYLMLGHKSTGKKLKRRLERSRKQLVTPDADTSKDLISEIKQSDLRIGQSLEHLCASAQFPVCRNDTSKYYPLGEDAFPDMCADLKKAKHFIFVEYFIIQSGKFWDTLTDIMAERAAEGVDVRVMYDDLGSISTYSVKDIAGLKKKGIKCIPFNPFFLISSQLNNRDHRKIMVIDGEVAYSGGINLADEYINEIERFGHWKDIAFRVTGTAVDSYTFMFAEFWNAFSIDKIPADLLEKNRPVHTPPEKENGYIIPYYDSPMREEHTSNELFTDMLSAATDHIWFYTPYLLLGDALFDAFIRAARRGVDVRIMTPAIPDKKIVHRLTRSYYEDLLKAGVKVYEYTPGFVHAKAFIADDKVGSIGTVNLDYRSLFLHFECNAVFFKADILNELKKDFIATQAKCKEWKLEDIKKGFLHKFVDNLLRVIAPLL
ncbi:cardiolipin synthase [Ruminococcaceae bacterium FB2012]|nr:cardiolipin synthase [Ruminococcaceae bacterium FB2012]